MTTFVFKKTPIKQDISTWNS